MRRYNFKKIMVRVLALTVMVCEFAFVMPETVKLPFAEEIAEVTLTEAAVKMNTSSVVLTPGKKYVVAISGDKKAYTWATSDKKVATVKRSSTKYKATITAKAEGVAIITATKGKNTFQCKVVVMKKDSTEPDTSGESIDKSRSFKDITVYEKKGTATVIRTQSTKKQKSIDAEKGMKLQNQDLLNVSKQSLLRMVLDDQEFIYLEENSQAAISKGWFNKCNVVLVKGEMVAEVQKKLDSGDSLNIQTPNTTMSIRGPVVAVKTTVNTDVTVETVNYVLQGSADVKVLDPKTKKYGDAVNLKAGEGLKVISDTKGETVKSEKAKESDLAFKDIDVSTLKGAGSNDSGNGGQKDVSDKYGITVNGKTMTLAFGNRNSNTITVENVSKIGYAAIGEEKKTSTTYTISPGTIPGHATNERERDDEEESYEPRGYILNDSQGIPVFYVSVSYADVTVSGSLASGEWTKLEAVSSDSYTFDTKMQISFKNSEPVYEDVSGTGTAKYTATVKSETREPVNGAVELTKGVWMAPERQSFAPCLIVVGYIK